MPNSEQAVGSKIWRCWAVMVDHAWTWETQRIVPRAIDMTVAMTTVRHVEGRVRSLVHSAFRARLIFGVRTGEAVAVR